MTSVETQHNSNQDTQLLRTNKPANQKIMETQKLKLRLEESKRSKIIEAQSLSRRTVHAEKIYRRGRKRLLLKQLTQNA